MSSTPSQCVYAFHAQGSRFCNAVFSSTDVARAWIAKHKLTGLLTEYDLDRPVFDTRREAGTLPALLRQRQEAGTLTAADVEQYVDGRVHFHFALGVGEDDPGFRDAYDRWEAQRTGSL